MGRGRAKAKQVKVARQLKYNSGGTDLDRLRTELGVGGSERDGFADADPDDHYGGAGEDAAGEDTDEDGYDEDDE